eukprot:693321_1
MYYSAILILITTYSSSSQSITTYDDLDWVVASTSLIPNTTDNQIIGYDDSNERIWLIGGSSTSNKLISYNISTNTFRHYDDIPYSIESEGDSYTQINDTIYMHLYDQAMNDEYIATFHVYNASLSNNTKIPKRVTNGVCITHRNTDFLFVLGGYDELGSFALEYFQIFNLNDQTWTNGPNMPQGRQSMTCIVVNDWLYVIGGVPMSSIIKINVAGYIDNIVNQTWIQLNDTLRPQANHIRSVLYEDDVFVIGDGFMDIIHTKSNDQVTHTNNTSYREGNGSIAAIIVNSTLYAFGGSNSNHSFQFVVLPTRKNINCTGHAICYSETISVLNEYEVNIYCSGYWACRSATFNIVNATNVNIYCLHWNDLDCYKTRFLLNNARHVNVFCVGDCRYINVFSFNTANEYHDTENTVTVLCDQGHSCSQGDFVFVSPNTKIMHTCNEPQACRNSLISAIPSRSLIIDCIYGCGDNMDIYAPMMQIDSNFSMIFHHSNGSGGTQLIYHANAFAPNTNLNFVCSNHAVIVVHGVQLNKFSIVDCIQTHAHVAYNNINFAYGDDLNYPAMNMLNNDTVQYNESYPTMVFYAKLSNAQNRKEMFKPSSYFAEITLVCVDSYVDRSCHSSIFDFSETQNATIVARNAFNITVYGPQDTFNSIQPKSISTQNEFYFLQTQEVNFLTDLWVGIFGGNPTRQVNIYVGNKTQHFYLECKYYDCWNSNLYFDINPFNYLLASNYKMNFQIWAGQYGNFANFTLYFSNQTQYDLSCDYNYTYHCPDYLLTLPPTTSPTLEPTAPPTLKPTAAPTMEPTAVPTLEPTVFPTRPPTKPPTPPTVEPTVVPTMDPTRPPTKPPTPLPTIVPTINPTETPQIAFTWIYSDISDPFQRIMITVHIEVNDHALNIDFNGFEWYIVDYNHSQTFLIDPIQYSAITIYTIRIEQDLYESVLVLPSLRTEYFGYGVPSNRRLMDSDSSFALSPNTDYGFKVGMVNGMQSPAEEISTNPLIEEEYRDCTIINVEDLIVFDDLLINCSRQSEDGTLYYNLMIDNVLLLPEFTNNISELTSILPIGDMESVLLIEDANNVKAVHRLHVHFPNIHQILSGSARIETTELMDAAHRILNKTDITDTEIAILYNFIVQMYDYNAVSLSEAHDFVDTLYSVVMMQDNPVIMNQLSILVQLTSNADIIDSVNTLNTLSEDYLMKLTHSISDDIDSEHLHFMVTLCQDLIINLEKLVSILIANSMADARYINKITESLIEYELYFAHVALLKSVPGERFRFDWNEEDKFKHIDALRFMSGNVDDLYYDYNDEPQCGYGAESLQIPSSFIANNIGIFDCTFSTSSMNNYIESNSDYERASNMVHVNIYSSNTSNMKAYDFDATNCSQYLLSLESSNSTLFDNKYELGEGVAFPFCGFWDGVSSWIDHDCYVQSLNETVIVCSCLHLTSFQLSVDDFIPQANLLSKWNFRSVTTDNLIQYPTVWIVILSLFVFCVMICLLNNLNPRKHKQDKSTILAYQDVVFETFKKEHISDDMIGVEIEYIDDILSDDRQYLGGGLKQILSTKNGKKNLCLLQFKLYLLYLRNDHILLSTFERTSGTNFSTIERFGCFYMYLCTISVCTAIFYGVEHKVTQDITASFLISLFGKLPVRMIKRCFIKSKPKQIERAIIVKEHEDYFKTKQGEEEGIDSPKLGDTMTVLSKHQLNTRQETIQKAIKRVKQSDSMHHRLTLVEEIRLVLFDAVYPYSHYCKHVSWMILVIWTATCCVFAIIYGLQFDILSQIEKTKNYDNLHNEANCWTNNQKLRIVDALSESQVFDTRLDDYFAGIENITDSTSFLLNVALSLLLSIFVWQPLTTYLITWIKLWAFTWHLRLDFGFGVVKKLCLRCCGLDKSFKKAMQRGYEGAAGDSASVLVHGDRPLDVIGFFSNDGLFLKTSKNAQNDNDETDGMLQLAKTIPFGTTIAHEKEDEVHANEQALLIDEEERDVVEEEAKSRDDESKSGYKSGDGDGEANYIQLQMTDI